MVSNWLGISWQYGWVDMKLKKMVGGQAALFQLFF
jgi:hypothetical protein